MVLEASCHLGLVGITAEVTGAWPCPSWLSGICGPCSFCIQAASSSFVFQVNRIKDQYKVSVRIPPDSEKSNLIRIEGDPQGVQQAKRELLELASRMVSPARGAQARIWLPLGAALLGCVVLGGCCHISVLGALTGPVLLCCPDDQHVSLSPKPCWRSTGVPQGPRCLVATFRDGSTALDFERTPGGSHSGCLPRVSLPTGRVLGFPTGGFCSH